MWAQIIKTRMKPGAEEQLKDIRDQVQSRVSGRPGLVHAYWMRSQKDQQEYYTVIVFESEEKAREGERELEQDPVFERLRSLEAGTPEYVDLDVIESMP